MSKASRAQGEGYSLLEKRDYAAAESAFEKAAAITSEPEEKAKAYLGEGQAYLAGGDAQAALRLFYEARRTYHLGTVASQTNRAIGEAYFDMGDYALARRYFSKGLEDLEASERELTIAKLIICCRDLDDVSTATRYRGQLKQPLSPEVERILATRRRPLPQQFYGREPEEEVDVDREPLPLPPVRRELPLIPQPPPEEGRLFVTSRDGWNARPPRRNIELMGQVEKITVHHTGGDLFLGNTRADAADEIRRIQKYHQNEQGWADIGYHFVVDRAGGIWQGRRLCYQGAHAGDPSPA